MALVTAFTAERMKQIEDTTVVGGLVGPDGHLLLSTRAGDQIDAGSTIGPQGIQGDQGPQGVQGDQGPQGIQGVKGDQGIQGVKGDQGLQGIQGVKGDQGLQGIQGIQGIDGSAATPAGTIALWASDVAPANWLICDGSVVSRTTYASLFAAIGIKYGAGDGSTTFALPNLKGRAPVGKDTAQTEFAALAQNGGEKTHLLTAAEMPAHTHTSKINVTTLYAAPAAGSATYGVNNAGSDSTSSVGGSTAHNNLQPYTVVNFIIKFTNGDTPNDSQLTDRVSALEGGTTSVQVLREKLKRAQFALIGGGRRKVYDGAFSWGPQFRTVGIGTDSLMPGGYWNIDMPPDGTVIPVHGHPTITSITVGATTAGRITVTSLGAYSALYYDVPIGQGAASQPNRFHLVDISTTFTIPDSWVLVINRTVDLYVPEWKWGDGRQQDWWHDFALINSWTNYPGYDPLQWRRSGTGEIVVRGLVRNGIGNAFCSVDSARPGPEFDQIATMWSNTGIARVDVKMDGTFALVAYAAGGSNAYISFYGVRWFPSGS